MRKLYCNYIFDLYGTLVDIRTNEEEHVLWNKMSLFYGYYGADYTPDELHESYRTLVSAKENAEKEQVHYAHEAYPEIPIEEVFQELYTNKGIQPSGELVLHTGQMFRVYSTHHIRLYAGARELLSALRKAGKGVYLLSNAQRIFTEYELFYLGIHDLFDGILISSDYGCKKPDERFYKILAEKYGVSAAESLMIGNDMDTDIAGAARAGMDSFYIRSAISPHAQTAVGTKHTHADYVMSRMNLLALKNRLLATDR